MAWTRTLFSTSTGGRGLTVTGTAATGTLIHTAVTGTSTFDEVYLWAHNTATANVLLTVEWARSTGSAGQPIRFTVPTRDGWYLIVPGISLNAGRQVRAYAATASVITVHGHVNRG